MQLRDIAVNNLKIRKTKMFFLILGIVLGITTVVTLTSITLAMQEQLESNFEAMGMRVLVTPVSKSLSLSYNGVSVASGTSYQSSTIPQDVAESLKEFRTQGVSVIAPKLVQPAEVMSDRGLVAGVDFESEIKIKPYWGLDGQVPRENEIMLGSVAATKLGLSRGDAAVVEGKQFKVSAVLNETGTSEDKLIFMNLDQAQRLFDRAGELSFIELSVVNSTGEETETAAQKTIAVLKNKFAEVNITPIKGQAQARREVVERFAKFTILVSAVVLFIGCLIVLTTMMSSVKERTREIGIFRAIGFRQSHIIKIILTEAIIISFIGGIIGYVAGILLAKVASPFIAQIDVEISWSFGLGATAILVSSLVGLVASAYPAYQAAKLDPVEAFRFI